MERYVDGYVLPIREEQVEPYREMATEAGEVWIEHGALQYVECVLDDPAPEVGDVEMVAFDAMMETDDDETVVFAFVVFESREHRDEVNAAVMEAMAESDEAVPMPFEVERMAYGGFRSLVVYGD